MLRVLVVDDSAVMRRMVTTTIETDPDLRVVGTAANGQLALERIEALKPDVVTLDIEMPVMSGLEALPTIRKTWPRLAVIMCSTLTERGASATLDALTLGASDYVTKPTATGSLTESKDRLGADLIPKIKALGSNRRVLAGASQGALRSAPEPLLRRLGPYSPTLLKRPDGPVGQIDVVAIGVSTGGPNALHTVVSELPADLPVPVVIVQHMPPTFTALLAQRLDRASAVSVHEADVERRLEAGHIYLAPGDHHLVVTRRGAEVWTMTTLGPPENSCRPAVDVLFRSISEVYGSRCLAVVLTGMGYDGLAGATAIVGKGGRVIAQDKETSVVWGMPGAIAGAEIADCLLPLPLVANEITRRTRIGRHL